jgi:hypothetical protein
MTEEGNILSASNEYRGSKKNWVFYLKRTVGFLAILTLAVTFFISAYSKSGIVFVNGKLAFDFSSFDNFQWSFLDLGISSILLTGIIARLMIGFELLLGLFLLFHIFLRPFTYKAIYFVLSIFIIYLIVIWAKFGNNGNCGCFGNMLVMKPSEAIIKNVIMIAATAALWFIYPIKPYKYQEFICLALALVAFSAPFVANPMYANTAPQPWNKPIALDSLYQYSPKPDIDLRKGKHIIAFMSLTCHHCKKAGHLLHIIHSEHPNIPIYFILDGPEAIGYRQSFFKETQATTEPYLFFKHDIAMTELVNSGYGKGEPTGVPAIYWVNNGIIEYRSTYYQLDPALMEKWSKDPNPLVFPEKKK